MYVFKTMPGSKVTIKTLQGSKFSDGFVSLFNLKVPDKGVFVLREVLLLSASSLLFTDGCVLTPHLDCCGHQVYCLLCLFVLLLEVDAKEWVEYFTLCLEYTMCVI